MPKYQYRCADCGADLEVQQKFTDDALTVCPECEGRLNKVFSAVGVVFKGSGFYKTDSRGDRTSPKASSTASSSTNASSSSSAAGTSGTASSSSTSSSGAAAAAS